MWEFKYCEVRQAADEICNDMTEDVVRDIRRNCSTVNIVKAHLQEDKTAIKNVVMRFVGPDLSEQIADALLADGISVDKD